MAPLHPPFGLQHTLGASGDFFKALKQMKTLSLGAQIQSFSHHWLPLLFSPDPVLCAPAGLQQCGREGALDSARNWDGGNSKVRVISLSQPCPPGAGWRAGASAHSHCPCPSLPSSAQFSWRRQKLLLEFPSDSMESSSSSRWGKGRKRGGGKGREGD